MKIVRESLFEVLRGEDEWANREIDKYQKKPVEKSPEKLNPYQTQYGDEKEKIIAHIQYLEEYIFENANPQQILEWEDYTSFFKGRKLEWKDLEMEKLELIFLKASLFVNELKHKSFE